MAAPAGATVGVGVGVGVVTVASVVGIVVKLRNERKRLAKLPKVSEYHGPQRRRELYQSFKHRDSFRVDHMPNSDNMNKVRDSFAAMQKRRVQPVDIKTIIEKYQMTAENGQEKTEFDMNDFRCPLTGDLILNDPVVLNGFVYERETLEDWIFQSDWLDPMFIFK